MSHIISYVSRQKNTTFEEMPFNEVDALVLSQFVYMKLEPLVPHLSQQKPPISLCELAEKMDEKRVFMDERYAKDNKALFRAMMESKRFQNMKMQYYSEILSVLAETQFAAMTVFLEKGPTVVVFRGTDETLVGWKEDFNMCFKEPVTGQSLSALYLQQVSDVLPEKFIVAGHSKGGNFAIYSSMNVKEEIQNKIEKVYSFDSPGFRPEILESADYNRIKERIYKYLPHSSIVGMLLQSKEDPCIVESTGVGISQHNPFHWQVEENHFKKLDGLDKGSEVFNESFNDWLFKMDDEQLRAFSEIWYHVFQEAHVNTLLDFIREPGKSLIHLWDAIKDLDEETKDMAKVLIKNLIAITRKTILAHQKEVAMNEREKLKAKRNIRRK